MSSTVSSIFSTGDISDRLKFCDDADLHELLSSFLSKRTPLSTSAFNSCYTKALLLLHKHVEEIDTKSVIPASKHFPSYNVNEDDFDATVFLNRSLTPSSTRISQWRHEQFVIEKFPRLLIPLVTENMYSIVLNWIELELSNEEERGSKNKQRRRDLQSKLNQLIAMKNDIHLERLYQLSGSSKDILIEQVDWKLIATKMRSKGNFKYFDEYSLKRLWIHRFQYELTNTWTTKEDEVLNQLVEQFGHGQWSEIAQHEIFQKNKKSAFMCAQRYMIKTNRSHTNSSRRFSQTEKDLLLSMYKYRCSVMKDYRFCVSYAAYVLGDRCLREISRVWTYLNPNIQKSSFTPEEDAVLLRCTSESSPICWSTIASSHLPDRSAVQCRQRYLQLTKSRSTEKKKKRPQTNSSRLTKYLQWLQKQPVPTQTFLEQFYSKTRMTYLQQSILELHPTKIELLLNKFSTNPNQITKLLPLRELTQKLNLPTVTIDEIYGKFVNNI